MNICQLMVPGGDGNSNGRSVVAKDNGGGCQVVVVATILSVE